MSKDIDIAQTFDRIADKYAVARPTYPDALFDLVTGHCQRRDRAWDVGCGTGQASGPLASRFSEVVASDPAPNILAKARKLPNVVYRCADAADSGCEDRSVDCVVAAQAAHWFDHERFYAEVRRVARAGCVIALWCYGLPTVTPEIDTLIQALYARVDQWWAPGRRYVETLYETLPFPFDDMRLVPPQIEVLVRGEAHAAYLDTWSALNRCRKETKTDPLAEVRDALLTAWGPEPRPISWPLGLRIARIP